jgi:predicted transglutaminase-like cysteine proteinase
MRLPKISRALIRHCRLVILSLACVAASGIAVQVQPDKTVQVATSRYGARGGQAVEKWLAAMRDAASLPELEKLKAMNEFWNRNVMGREDIDVWKQTDYWATPVESLGKGAGDCEDFVIGKFFSLLALGVDPNKLRFVYVRANLGGAQVAHMVLGYYPTPTSIPLVLDSLLSPIMKANERRDLTPVFSFNASGVYVNGQEAAPVDRIGRWRELLTRMQRDGIQP